MKKILNYHVLGVPVVGTIVGSFLLVSTMFMWYGSFFVGRFHPLMGIVEAQVTTETLGFWYVLGFAFAAIQGLGISLVLKWRGWPKVLVSAQTGFLLALLLGCMVFTYELVILPKHSIDLFLINASGLLVAWTLCAAGIGLLRPTTSA